MTPKDLWYKDAIFYQVYLRAFKDSNARVSRAEVNTDNLRHV